jgi:hypothetical protein
VIFSSAAHFLLRVESLNENGSFIVMLKNADEVKSAVQKVVEARMTIWNARLELALAQGDPRRIDAVLARVPGEADAGQGCGCGCGCGSGGGSLQQ